MYDPFGLASYLAADWSTRSSSSLAWLYLHQTARLGASTGLYDFRMRQYSPALGRWIQIDPIRFDAADANFYRYVGNSPVGNVDPTGRQIMNPRGSYGTKGGRPGSYCRGGGSSLQMWAQMIEQKKRECLKAMSYWKKFVADVLACQTCCPKEDKEKVLGILSDILDAACSVPAGATGFFGGCEPWLDRYEEKIRGLRDKLDDSFSHCVKVEYWAWKYKGFEWTNWGHNALRISFCDHMEIYVDDGNHGGLTHVFGRDGVPFNYVPLQRPPIFRPKNK